MVLGEVQVGRADRVQPSPGRVGRQGGAQLRLQLREGLPHHREHDRRLVREVPVDRRRRDPDLPGHRPQGDRLLVAGLVQ
jgi:hypothetical protein